MCTQNGRVHLGDDFAADFAGQDVGGGAIAPDFHDPFVGCDAGCTDVLFQAGVSVRAVQFQVALVRVSLEPGAALEITDRHGGGKTNSTQSESVIYN